MRYTCSLPALLSLGLCALLAALPQAHAEDAAGMSDNADKTLPQRTVVFVPVGLGPFAEVDANASKRIPREMVDYVKRNKAKFEARLAESMPDGDNEIWADPVTACRLAGGSHYTIVATIDSIVSKKNLRIKKKNYKKREIQAMMTVRAINPASKDVAWIKTFVGKVPEKLSETDGQALGQKKQAVNKAAAKCMNALLQWLNTKYDSESNTFIDDSSESLKALPLLDIMVKSLPEGADIHVDGWFRGKTPTTVPLTARTWVIKIERKGYQPWVKEVKISPEMVIQPALEPIGAETK